MKNSSIDIWEQIQLCSKNPRRMSVVDLTDAVQLKHWKTAHLLKVPSWSLPAVTKAETIGAKLSKLQILCAVSSGFYSFNDPETLKSVLADYISSASLQIHFKSVTQRQKMFSQTQNLSLEEIIIPYGMKKKIIQAALPIYA